MSNIGISHQPVGLWHILLKYILQAYDVDEYHVLFRDVHVEVFLMRQCQDVPNFFRGTGLKNKVAVNFIGLSHGIPRRKSMNSEHKM